jgi:hypothetical protein
MEIKVYVNYYERETITEKEYQKKVEQEINERMEDKELFNDWLGEKYFYYEIYEMTPTKKERVKEKYREDLKDDVLDEFNDEWEEIILEV